MAWDKTDEEIIAYLSGELTSAEGEAFEQRLQSDPSLADALERHKAFEKKLSDYGAYQAKAEEIRILNQQALSSPSRKKIYLYVFLAAAVGTLLLILFTGNQQQYCPEELYAEVSELRDAPEMAGQAANAEQLLRLGHSRFNQQRMAEAADLYQQALAAASLSDSQQREAHFYLGQCQMSLKEFAAAVSNLQNISQGPYLQLAQWYTALSLLAMGRIEEANTMLTSISSQRGHDRQRAATDLLQEWHKLKEC